MSKSSVSVASLTDAEQLLQLGQARLVEAHGIVRQLLTTERGARPRGQLNQRLWDIERMLGRRGEFFSQSGQDAWLERNVFKGKRNGTFVEIGGYDGVTGSNCLYFELHRGWQGLLVEPSPGLFARASAARRCHCLQLALASGEGEAPFLEVREGLKQMGGLVENYDQRMRTLVEGDTRHQGGVISVPTRTLASLLDEAGMREVDYISLDVEGAEMAILAGFDFDRFRVKAWSVENNRGDLKAIPALMAQHGYQRVDALGADDLYVLQDAA